MSKKNTKHYRSNGYHLTWAENFMIKFFIKRIGNIIGINVKKN